MTSAPGAVRSPVQDMQEDSSSAPFSLHTRKKKMQQLYNALETTL